MKILVFASCSKRKAISYPNQPTCQQINSKEMREAYLPNFSEKRKAKDLYRGSLNISTNAAVRHLREMFDVGYYIVSAGFGIVNEEDIMPPYECSFSEMRKDNIIERANALNIPNDYQEIIKKENPDFMYLALGKNYLMALGNWDENLPCKTIAFEESTSDKVITLPADHIAVQEVSRIGGMPIHGVIGFKGDLLLLATRFLKNQRNPEKALVEILDTPNDLKQMIAMLRSTEDR